MAWDEFHHCRQDLLELQKGNGVAAILQFYVEDNMLKSESFFIPDYTRNRFKIKRIEDSVGFKCWIAPLGWMITNKGRWRETKLRC